MKRLFLALFFVAACTCVLASDFELRIISYPEKVIQGEPMWVTAEIRNVSGHPITVCTGKSHSFNYAFKIRRADGKPRLGCSPTPMVKLAPHYGTKELPAEWKDVIRQDLACRYAANADQNEEPGDLIVEFTLVSNAPCSRVDSQGTVLGQYKAWTGKLSAPEVHISLCNPSGVDLEAYRAYKGFPLSKPEDLLKRFPTSTYAGYELLHYGPGFTMWDLVDLSDKSRDQHLAIPQGASIEKQDELRTKYLASYQSFLDKADKFLTLHPDFSERDLLRKEMANALFLLGHQDEALSQVKLIEAKEGPLAEEAKKTLQKAGLVKPSCKSKDKK